MMSGIEFPEFIEGEIAHQSRAIRGAVDVRVVEQDRHAVASRVDVAFENFGANLNGAFEGHQRVFRRGARGAAMANDYWGRNVEERVRHAAELISKAVGQ
jgi:hypothetical protein